MLRMEGPLGLSGQALTLVCTYTLKASESDGTLLTLNINGAGEFTPETPEVVRQVWEHFPWERFKPYIEEHHASYKQRLALPEAACQNIESLKINKTHRA